MWDRNKKVDFDLKKKKILLNSVSTFEFNMKVLVQI
jgi:hypothetical protein